MIELKLTVSELDYDALVRHFGGSLGSTLALAAKALPDSAKDDLAVKYLNSNAGAISQKIEQMAANRGVRLKIRDAQARTVK